MKTLLAAITIAAIATGCRTVNTGGQTVTVAPFRGAAGTAETDDIQTKGAVNIVIVTGEGTQDAAKATEVGREAAVTATP